MNKKQYMKPTTQGINLEVSDYLLTGSVVSVEGGDTDLEFIGGGIETPLSREFDLFKRLE